MTCILSLIQRHLLLLANMKQYFWENMYVGLYDKVSSIPDSSAATEAAISASSYTKPTITIATAWLFVNLTMST